MGYQIFPDRNFTWYLAVTEVSVGNIALFLVTANPLTKDFASD